MGELPTGTVTFLFTDIEGSTRLWDERPREMASALERHDILAREMVESAGGHIFKTVGDAVCAVFSDGHSAIEAAIGCQRALAAEPWPDEAAIRVRMALHSGRCEERDDDYFGPAVNRVARILALGHGGQVLVSEATSQLAVDLLSEGVTMLDLGEHRLRDLSRAERIFQLVAGGLNAEFPPLRSLDRMPTNLPVQLTSFVGRQTELAWVRDALTAHRVVTVTGTGGVGKTRLALQVAADAQPRFRHGVWLCDFAPTTSPDDVAPLVAAVVGTQRTEGGAWADAIVSALSSQRVLLVLDNCEHVLDAVCALAVALVRTCPEVVMLATSREGLGIPGEQIMPVGPLTLPAADEPPVSARGSDAVELFIARAGEVRPQLRDDDATVNAIAQVCRRLDGIPLAIELAAARMQSLSAGEIARLLDDRFGLLTRGSRTALARHQTLRAAIDWSFDLLSEPERVVMARISTFAGGFTLDAAVAVCSSRGSVSAAEVVDHVDTLVRRSLLVAEDHQDATRYRMLETIRQYGAERLEADGSAAEANRAHLDWCVAFVIEAGEQMRGPDDAAWGQRMARELDNVGTALRYAVSIRDLDAATSLLASAPSGMLWATQLGASLAALAASVLPAVDEADHPMTTALLWLSSLDALLRFVSDEAVELAQRACRTARDTHVSLRTGPWLALLLASLIADRGEVLVPIAREALAIATEEGDVFAVAEWHGELGIALCMAGEPEEGQAFTETGMRLAEEIGATNLLMRNAFLRGTSFLIPLPEPDLAIPFLERSAALGAALGGNLLFAGAAWSMLLAIRGSDDIEAAAADLRDQCIALARINQRGSVRFWSTMAASLLALAEEYEAAAVLIGAGQMLRFAAGALVAALWDQTVSHARDELGDGRFEELLAEGRSMPLDDVTAFLLGALDRVATASAAGSR